MAAKKTSGANKVVGIEDGFVRVGHLMGAHGVKGLVKVASYTDDPTSLFAYDCLTLAPEKGAKVGKPITLVFKHMSGGQLVTASPSIASREEAESLRGKNVFVPREKLIGAQASDDNDEDSYFLVDLIGLEVRGEDGTAMGHVRSVENYGAEDLLELVLDKPLKGFRRFVLIPFRVAYVPEVSIDGGFVRVSLSAWQAAQTGGDVVEQGGDEQDT